MQVKCALLTYIKLRKINYLKKKYGYGKVENDVIFSL